MENIKRIRKIQTCSQNSKAVEFQLARNNRSHEILKESRPKRPQPSGKDVPLQQRLLRTRTLRNSSVGRRVPQKKVKLKPNEKLDQGKKIWGTAIFHCHALTHYCFLSVTTYRILVTFEVV